MSHPLCNSTIAGISRDLPQGLLLVSELPAGGRLKERQVFLFEQIIIISDTVGPKSQFSNPVYIYKNHLQVDSRFL